MTTLRCVSHRYLYHKKGVFGRILLRVSRVGSEKARSSQVATEEGSDEQRSVIHQKAKLHLTASNMHVKPVPRVVQIMCSEERLS